MSLSLSLSHKRCDEGKGSASTYHHESSFSVVHMLMFELLDCSKQGHFQLDQLWWTTDMAQHMRTRATLSQLVDERTPTRPPRRTHPSRRTLRSSPNGRAAGKLSHSTNHMNSKLQGELRYPMTGLFMGKLHHVCVNYGYITSLAYRSRALLEPLRTTMHPPSTNLAASTGATERRLGSEDMDSD